MRTREQRMNQQAYPWCGMDTSDELRALAVAIISLKEQLSGFFIQRRFRIRVNQQTLDGQQNMSNAIC